MTRAAHAVAREVRKRLREIAAKSLGGTPEDYEVANERVFQKGGSGMTLAQAAQRAIQLGGIYDGHEAHEKVNEFIKASVAALAGQGLVNEGQSRRFRTGGIIEVTANGADDTASRHQIRQHLKHIAQNFN